MPSYFSVLHPVPRHKFEISPDMFLVAQAQTSSKLAVDISRKAAVLDAKQQLKSAIGQTNRGGTATRTERAKVEEAQVSLESLSGKPVDYNVLKGSWRLLYTSAPDVVPLLTASIKFPLSLFTVGDVYQKFCSVEDGSVQNIIKLSVPLLLRPENGITLTVNARYSIRSPRRIALTFEEAVVGDVQISSTFEAFLAPALLPRGWLNHRILLAIQEFLLRVPLRQSSSALEQPSSRARRFIGSEYLLTYLDEDTLIGRQTGPGGAFIFERAQRGLR